VFSIFPPSISAAPWKQPLWIYADSSVAQLLNRFTIKPASANNDPFFCFAGSGGGISSAESGPATIINQARPNSLCWRSSLEPGAPDLLLPQTGEVQYTCKISQLHPGYFEYQTEAFLNFQVESIIAGHLTGRLPGIDALACEHAVCSPLPYRVIVWDRYVRLNNANLSDMTVTPDTVGPFLVWDDKGLLLAHWSWTVVSDLNRSQEIANICLVLIGVASSVLVALSGFLIKRLLPEGAGEEPVGNQLRRRSQSRRSQRRGGHTPRRRPSLLDDFKAKFSKL
jgi:hypothetical protein